MSTGSGRSIVEAALDLVLLRARPVPDAVLDTSAHARVRTLSAPRRSVA